MGTDQAGVQLDALGDPSRRAIVEILTDGPLPVAEIAARMPISRPAVSQHLKVLKEAHLLTSTTHGTRRLYRLDDTGLTDLRRYFAAHWRHELDDFADFVRDSTSEGEQ